MTYTEAKLREQVRAMLSYRQPREGEQVHVHPGTLEQYRHEQGKAKHEPLWLEVDARRGARVVRVNVQVVA